MRTILLGADLKENLKLYAQIQTYGCIAPSDTCTSDFSHMPAIRSNMKWIQRQQYPGEWRMVFSRCHNVESCQYTHETTTQHHSPYADNTCKHVANPQYTLAHDQSRVYSESEI